MLRIRAVDAGESRPVRADASLAGWPVSSQGLCGVSKLHGSFTRPAPRQEPAVQLTTPGVAAGRLSGFGVQHSRGMESNMQRKYGSVSAPARKILGPLIMLATSAVYAIPAVMVVTGSTAWD
ncbi:hypothetical protein GCM10025331_66140 [Actinoplanes utahensis]|nr:hypothetical protein Aut01nite_54570 [Actinoplanes utahensis]